MISPQSRQEGRSIAGILILIAIAAVIVVWDRRNGGKAWRSVANSLKASMGSEPATPPRAKGQVGEIVANDAVGKVYNDLGEPASKPDEKVTGTESRPLERPRANPAADDGVQSKDGASPPPPTPKDEE